MNLQGNENSPFRLDLAAKDEYERWRDEKLRNYPEDPAALVVEVKRLASPTPAEHEALLKLCGKTNMALYDTGGAESTREDVRAFGSSFGLRTLDSNLFADDDGLTELTVNMSGDKQEFIPYTDRPIHWHTDGYYNTPDREIRGLLLHCVTPAEEGGANRLLDHELVYIRLRERNPDYIRALMEPDIMAIPANVMDGVEIRPEIHGPVFSVAADGRLQMRFTDRAKNIRWKSDPLSAGAVKYLKGILQEFGPGLFHAKLERGQGLLSNNVLHDRSGFRNDPENPRLLYRARYYERIAGT